MTLMPGFFPKPFDKPETRLDAFYWIMVKRVRYALDEEGNEHKLTAFRTIGLWFAGEWYLCGEAEPIPESDVAFVADKVKSFTQW